MGMRLRRDLVRNVQAEVAAAFDPFVVLFGQDGADEADEGVAVGEGADDVGAAADLAVEALVGPDLAPQLLGKAVKARTSARAASRWECTSGSLSATESRSLSNWACTASGEGWS